MRAADANALRAVILKLRAQGLKPREIARRVRCDPTTVYRVLRRPGPDRRTTKRRVGSARERSAVQARLLAVLEGLTAGRAGEGDEPQAPDPYADLADAEYALARADGAVGPETALARYFLRGLLRELEETKDEDEARRTRLRRQAGDLLRTFARVHRGEPGGKGLETAIAGMLTTARTEVEGGAADEAVEEGESAAPGGDGGATAPAEQHPDGGRGAAAGADVGGGAAVGVRAGGADAAGRADGAGEPGGDVGEGDPGDRAGGGDDRARAGGE